MRVGLIARADSTGLGIQSKEFFDNIPCRALVIDSSRLGKGDVLKCDLTKYPDQKAIQLDKNFSNYGWMPYDVMSQFLNGIDVLFCIETPYDYRIFEEARKRGIKSILQFNYEFLEYPSGLPEPDLFAAPSLWNYDKVPEPKAFVQVPVNLSKFKQQPAKNTFLHIAGRPAAHDRNGTQILLNALKFVKSEITLTIKSQGFINPVPVPKNVKLIIDNRNQPKYQDNYTGGTLIIPRKYGGLCLPINEALGAGMPVVATDISPNNLWLPKEWLIPAKKTISFQCRKSIDVYESQPEHLAAKIDQFCQDDFYSRAVSIVNDFRQDISWAKWRPIYHEIFDGVKIRTDQLNKQCSPDNGRPRREFYRSRPRRNMRARR
jgi:glycosyltransferase involved in cell wall biosynthesis